MWMTGNAMRLMERTPPGVLHTDLAACNAYAGGLAAAQRGALPGAAGARARATSWRRRRMRSALIAALPTSAVVTLPDCGHAMMAEEPDAVLDALRAFLADAVSADA